MNCNLHGPRMYLEKKGLEMDSYSMTVMKKALFLSVLIHLIILFFLGKMTFSVYEIPDFPEIRITFARAVIAPPAESYVERGSKESVEKAPPKPAELKPEPPLQEQKASVPVASREDIHQKEEALTEPAAVPTEEKVKAAADKAAVSTTATADNMMEAAVAVESTLPVDKGEGHAGESADNSEVEGASSSDLPDFSWEGGALSLRSIPEPEFSIPYGAALPESIDISFTVLNDGTVMSISILPPGSGHVDLDRQIRAYVADFLFEEFDSTETIRRGTLKLFLKAMGSSGI